MSMEMNKAPVEQAGGDEREAFEAYRDRRNALLESEGHKPGSKWHVTNAHYPTWEASRAALAQPSPAPAEAERLREAYEWGYGDGQNNPNGYSDKKERDACVNELLKQPSTVQAEAERPTYECTMGVGGGDGNLFVHGDHASIKAAQKIVLERDAALARVEQQERTIAGMNEAHAKLAGLYEAAQAQHSVPDGWVQSLPLKDHQPCKSNEDRANGYVIPIYSRPVPVEEALRKLRAVLCDPVGNVVIDGSDGDREEVQRALGILAAAPGKEGV